MLEKIVCYLGLQIEVWMLYNKCVINLMQLQVVWFISEDEVVSLVDFDGCVVSVLVDQYCGSCMVSVYFVFLVNVWYLVFGLDIVCI